MSVVANALERAWEHHQARQWQLAEALYRQVLEADPAHATAWQLLGLLAQQTGRLDLARHCQQRLVHLQPTNPEAHFQLGLLDAQRGDLEAAIAAWQQTLRLRPNWPTAWYNVGLALVRLGRFDEAIAPLETALRFKPDFADAHNTLGTAHLKQGRVLEAIRSLREAIRHHPDFADAHYNLGIALKDLRRLDEAQSHYEAAIRLKPGFAQAHYNLGALLALQGNLQQAIACYEEAIRLVPDFADAHYGRAVAWLALGDWRRGWPAYEWRWRQPGAVPRVFAQPPWDGSTLAGKTILLHAEQGLGDTLQFIRFAPLLQRQGATVLFEGPARLLPLLSRCAGVDRWIAAGSPLPPFDVHAPLLSVPGLLGITLADIPAEVPYLFADPTLVARWRNALSAESGLRVGIAWQGNPRVQRDHERSIPLAEFAPLAEVLGVRLFSLQKGPGSEQLLSVSFPVVDLGRRLDEDGGAFMDTAAVLHSLDLVITSDTALAHLAGGMGRPTWLALSAAPDWRWLRGRDDSPWYPTARLFRQSRLGQWRDVFIRLRDELAQLAHRRSSAGTLPTASD
ncbi:MAG: tetratricopeptide repeat-containing glycosyltransferase family protein [Gemmataceae bacterium]|nr:tetratricopeptide repeat-containing glycosyltransferase family protein [Gemmataceae bacterium]MDW8265192.1 tetratricopeptide repeat-containing glycosyltransferase family protein [Gemmataceae bacterium]